MKKIITIILALCGLAFAAAAQESTVLAFDALEHDFGRIPQKGGRVSAEFWFVNTGSTPAVITDAKVSCKCTTVVYPKKPVMPGAREVIRVTYDPKGHGGVFLKAIQVLSSTPDKRQIITVKGEVY